LPVSADTTETSSDAWDPSSATVDEAREAAMRALLACCSGSLFVTPQVQLGPSTTLLLLMLLLLLLIVLLLLLLLPGEGVNPSNYATYTVIIARGFRVNPKLGVGVDLVPSWGYEHSSFFY